MTTTYTRLILYNDNVLVHGHGCSLAFARPSRTITIAVTITNNGFEWLTSATGGSRCCNHVHIGRQDHVQDIGIGADGTNGRQEHFLAKGSRSSTCRRSTCSLQSRYTRPKHILLEHRIDGFHIYEQVHMIPWPAGKMNILQDVIRLEFGGKDAGACPFLSCR